MLTCLEAPLQSPVRLESVPAKQTLEPKGQHARADPHRCANIKQKPNTLWPGSHISMSRTTRDDAYASTYLSWGRPCSGFAIPRRLYTADSPVRPSVKRVSSSSPSVWRFTQTRSSSRADRSAYGSVRSHRETTRRTYVRGDRAAAQCAPAQRSAVPRKCSHPRNSCLARRGALRVPFAP